MKLNEKAWLKLNIEMNSKVHASNHFEKKYGEE